MVFLRASAEIERVKKVGRRVQTPTFNLQFCPAHPPLSGQSAALRGARVGIVVGKRLGTAVLRNRAKRIFRELARHVGRRLAAGRDLVVFPKRDSLAMRHDELRNVWISVLEREGLLVK